MIKFIKMLFVLAFINTIYFAQEKSDLIKIVDDLTKENDIPGLNVSLIFEDGSHENYSAGYADVERTIKMDSNFVMFSGSIGKTYAVALLMQLVDAEKVDLNKKFIEYFPEVEWLKNLPNINDFTVLMLLQHSSGLPRYVAHKEVWETTRNEPDKVWTYEDRLSYIFEDKPVHEAGKGWSYSDTGYLLIGMLVENFLGDLYENVNEKLLITNNLTTTYGAIRRDLPNLAVGYSELQAFLTPKVTVENGIYYFNPQMEWTGGGFASTTPDLARWAKLYYTGNLFSDSLSKKIITPEFETGPNEKYGAGSFIYNTQHGIAYGHSGLMPGYNSIFAYYPKHRLAVALQINCDYAKKNYGLVEYLDKVLEFIL